MQVLLISVVCLINRCYSCMQLHSFVWRAGFSQSQFHCIGLTWMFWFPGKKNPYVVFKIRFPFCFTASRGLGTMVLRKWVYVSENQQRARGDWKGGEAHQWCVELIKKINKENRLSGVTEASFSTSLSLKQKYWLLPWLCLKEYSSVTATHTLFMHS